MKKPAKADEQNPLGANWKQYWSMRQEDPDTRRQTRQEKREARRRIHKAERRAAKKKIENDLS